MPGKSAVDSLKKYETNAAAAGSAMTAGVTRTTVNPSEKAAAAVDKYAAGVQKAVTDGTFVRGCQSSTLEDWKAATGKKGAENMVNGVRNLSPKAKRKMQSQFEKANAISQEIQSMPNVTEADAERRMLENVKKMRATKGTAS